MPKKPKEKLPPGKAEPKVKGEATLTDDQAERGYYYDDAYGYEEYRDDNDACDENETS